MDLGASYGGHGTTRSLAGAEEARHRLQAQLDAERTPAERNELGQFATPPGLALDIGRYVARFWEKRQDRVRFLEPAVGSGSFFSALLQALPSERWQSARGIELDSRFAKAARDLWGPFGLEVIEGDFTRLEPPRSCEERANLICTNPPYVRHHHLDAGAKAWLKEVLASRVGLQISGLAGLYCYFLLLADNWLAHDGLSVWLIPTEFLTVNYGVTIRHYLAERVTLLHIHIFDAHDVQFDDALVSSAIVVFQKTSPRPDHAVTFSVGNTLSEPREVRQVPVSRLRKARKWLSLFSGDGARKDHELTLSDLFKIKRGIATGCNEFFVMPRTQAAEKGIPEQFLRPILPSPRYLKEAVVEAAADGHPALPKQLVVIDCPLAEPVVKEQYPALWAYLEEGKTTGVAKRYLASRRDPWYKQESRKAAPFLCTYMGRGSNGGTPFRFIWNKSKATATNVYLTLYPIGVMAEALKTDPSLYPVVFALLNEISPADLKAEGRVYGGGLHKMEPAELGRIPATKFLEAIRNTQQMASTWMVAPTPSLFDLLPTQSA